MTSTCYSCKNMTLAKVTQQQARAGHGYCTPHTRFTLFIHSPRECDQYAPAEDKTVAKRGTYLQK